ncbi:nitrilase-related carbon-nitrogen hydrolase [Streptomyces sp. RLB1-33]|nr:nitrilase-related carbon-nitrogen hydrolase [Streptomyces sp. RLB1-33]QIY68403.1 hypothetical protein HEP84_03090 [Streptomyces sp. RLB1-33]
MPQLRLAMNQIDSTVGDLCGNAESIVRWTRHTAERGAHLVAFPEMALTGFPLEDLALRSFFVEASRTALDALARRLAEEGFGELPVVVGYIDRGEARPHLGQPADAPRNAAAVLHGGEVVLRLAKHRLQNYGVFDEVRYFIPGDTLPVVRVRGVDVALAICEDLWHDGGRAPAARAAGAGLLLSNNGSPYEFDKHEDRLEVIRRRAQEAGCTLAYLTMTGGQDELVFDGDSIVVSAQGEVIARARQFEEVCTLVDLNLPAAAEEPPAGVLDGGLVVDHRTISAEPLPPYEIQAPGGQTARLGDDEELYTALVVGLRGYVAKNGFRSVLIGPSGGIDSALVAAIACDAIVAAGHDTELVTRVLRMVDATEYKRRQYPPGTKISPKVFGKDRRLPITNRWRESA